MAENTYRLIASSILTSTSSSIVFSSIPQTFNDLYLFVSARDSYTSTNDSIFSLRMNGLTSGYSDTLMGAASTTIFNYRNTGNSGFEIYGLNATNATSDAFATMQTYIPNYIGTDNKVICATGAPADMASSFNFGMALTSGNQTTTSAITSLTILPSVGPFIAGSSFYLYGIKNS